MEIIFELVDICGFGFMVVVEFNIVDGIVFYFDMVNCIWFEVLKWNFILLICGVYGNVICFFVLIIIEDVIFVEVFDIFEVLVVVVKEV